MEQKKVAKCGFNVRKSYEGQKNFDTDYVSITIKKVAKSTGIKDADGDELCTEVEKFVETRKPIREVIDADAESTGIDAYMRPFVLSGTEPNVHFDEKAPIIDYTKMPQDLADSKMLSARAAVLFDALPEELKGGAKTLDDFFGSFNQEKFMSYVKKNRKTPVNTENKEEK